MAVNNDDTTCSQPNSTLQEPIKPQMTPLKRYVYLEQWWGGRNWDVLAELLRSVKFENIRNLLSLSAVDGSSSFSSSQPNSTLQEPIKPQMIPLKRYVDLEQWLGGHNRDVLAELLLPVKFENIRKLFLLIAMGDSSSYSSSQPFSTIEE